MSGLHWQEVSRLCQSIHNHSDRIIFLLRPR